MEELQEGFMKEQASFWLTSTLTQFGREVMELARQGLESYGAPVAFHFSTILGTWRQGRDAYEAGDYAQALRLAQATQDSINEIAEMQLLYPHPKARSTTHLRGKTWNPAGISSAGGS